METGSRPTTKRKPAIEREHFVTNDGTKIVVAHFHTPAAEKGILLIPPLIGGSFILFGRQFSYLVKQGYRVVSFNYRGHDKSEGKFSLKSSFDDTRELARRLKTRHPHLPLIGIGTCSGSMPLFHILNSEPDLLDRLVFVNAIYHLQQTATPAGALKIYWQERGVSWPESSGDLAYVILDHLFPEIDKGPDHFGIMTFERVAMGRIAREYILHNRPKISFCSSKPALCLYGRGDELLELDKLENETDYRAQFEKRFPNVTFDSFQADHFMSGIKEDVAKTIHRFIETATLTVSTQVRKFVTANPAEVLRNE